MFIIILPVSIHILKKQGQNDLLFFICVLREQEEKANKNKVQKIYSLNSENSFLSWKQILPKFTLLNNFADNKKN